MRKELSNLITSSKPRQHRYDENITHIICECGVRPEDVSTVIMHESVGISPTGQQVPIVVLEVVLQSFDVENWNKRIYGASLVMNAINKDGMIQNDISKGAWIGEAGQRAHYIQ